MDEGESRALLAEAVWKVRGVLDVETWLRVGRSQGWLGEEFCAQHAMTPYTEDELTEIADGEDPDEVCLPSVRLTL